MEIHSPSYSPLLSVLSIVIHVDPLLMSLCLSHSLFQIPPAGEKVNGKRRRGLGLGLELGTQEMLERKKAERDKGEGESRGLVGHQIRNTRQNCKHYPQHIPIHSSGTPLLFV